MAAAAAPLPALHCCCWDSKPRALNSPPPTSLLSLSAKSSAYGSLPLPPWTGLKTLGIAYRKSYVPRESKGRSKGRVYASLFGVGAPEALVIGVVALLVFGPKGLAEVARNLGKTLRAFQPTIRELQDVSREFKTTLEREIGLDEVASPMNSAYRSNSVVNEDPKPVTDPNGSPATTVSYTSEELLKVTEKQLAAASGTGPQAEASNPEQQTQASVTTPEERAGSEVAVTPAAPDAASQASPPQKADDR